MSFLESHLIALYNLLGHDYSRMGSLDYSTGKYENVFVKGQKEVLDYARRHNGSRNIFIGRSSRDANGLPISVNAVTFDIDPIRDKGVAATNEQNQRALAGGKRIIDTYPGGYLASSGNGCLLVYAVPSFHNFRDQYAKEASLIKELQLLVNDLGLKIDSTNYEEAVIKAIGTMSTKGNAAMHRRSEFVTFPVKPYNKPVKLLEKLASIKPLPVTSPENIQDIMSRFKGDRSIADYHLVSYLKKSGVGPAEALLALKQNPLGRQEDEKDQARLISKIYGSSVSEEIKGNGGTSSYFDGLFDTRVVRGAFETGFSDLDEAIGEVPKGEIVTVAARSGYGKSTFACTVAEHLRKQKKRVLYFSTEMHNQYIMHKLVALSCEIPLQSVVQRKFGSRETVLIREWQKAFEAFPIRICDDFQPTLEKVRNEIMAYKPDLVIFDHINQASTHWEAIAQFMRSLKDLAKQEEVVMLVLSQLNEPGRNAKGEEHKSIRGDVRGTQEIIFLSAVFAFIANPYDVKGQYQPVEFHIAKNRYGISGNVVNMKVDKVNSLYMEGENAANVPEV